MAEWIGVDLDGTLAEYHGWDAGKIGKPVPRMVERVKKWLADGIEVRIMTARANNGLQAIIYVMDWCKEFVGQSLPVTSKKDFEMIELWDDRCVQVIKNTGERADGKL